MPPACCARRELWRMRRQRARESTVGDEQCHTGLGCARQQRVDGIGRKRLCGLEAVVGPAANQGAAGLEYLEASEAEPHLHVLRRRRLAVAEAPVSALSVGVSG